MSIHEEFKVHRLNEQGLRRAEKIAQEFNDLLTVVVSYGGANSGRHLSLVKTKLEEACFFAKKIIASQPENQIEAAQSA